MTDPRDDYRRKLTTNHELVASLTPGTHLLIGTWASQPHGFIRALNQREDGPDPLYVTTHLSLEPSAYLDRFWLDTVTFDAGWLAYLVGRFGADRMVLGSDYPLPLGPRDPAAEVRALGLDLASEAAILGGNACGLLGIPHGAEAAA